MQVVLRPETEPARHLLWVLMSARRPLVGFSLRRGVAPIPDWVARGVTNPGVTPIPCRQSRGYEVCPGVRRWNAGARCGYPVADSPASRRRCRILRRECRLRGAHLAGGAGAGVLRACSILPRFAGPETPSPQTISICSERSQLSYPSNLTRKAAAHLNPVVHGRFSADERKHAPQSGRRSGS